MSNSSFSDAIRKWADERRLAPATVQRWLEMKAADASALLEVAQMLRLRTAQFTSAMELLQELALREERTISSLLNDPELHRSIAGNGSRPQRAAAFIAALRAMRRPRLARIKDALRREMSALALPSGAKVRLPPELGSDELTLEIIVRSGAELDKILQSLEKGRARLERIMAILGGEHEI